MLGVAPTNVGAAIARRFVDHGAGVVIAGRRQEAFDQVAHELGVTAITCDMTDGTSIDQAVTAATERVGLNFGVNSTGRGLLKPFLATDRDDLDRMTAVQFTGPFLFFQALLHAMTAGARSSRSRR